MSINRKFFLTEARNRLFDGSLGKNQAIGLLAILDKWERLFSRSDDRWLAYMLGTVHHETGRTMQPVRETFATSDGQVIARLEKAFGLGRLPWVKTPYWRPDGNGKSWYGRGLVQITHKANYKRLGDAIGVDLVADPGLALKMDVALKIMFSGMIQGLFTGKALGDFFSGDKENWRQARRIINGLERADLVAGYARAYYGCISYTTG